MLSDTTSVGLNYRSAVRHSFSGTAAFQIPAAATPLTAGGLFQDTSIHSQMSLPEVVAAGISHKVTERLTILADIDWTGWHRLRQFHLDFANPAQPDQTLILKWHDTVRFAVGGIYDLTNKIGLRTGISWDQAPTSNTYRGAELPDADEIIGSAGVSYHFDSGFSAIVSYSYGSYASAPVNLSLFGAGTLAGTFRRSSNAFALQLRTEL